MTLDNFQTLMTTSHFRFYSDSTFYDPLEGNRARLLNEEFETLDSKDLKVVQSDFFFCHCWFISDHSRTDMLSDNRSNPKQVVIQTSFQSLFDSIENDEVFAGKVSYRNTEDFDHQLLSNFSKRFVKDHRFDTEDEFRLLIVRENRAMGDPVYLEVRLNLPTLIQKIHLRKDDSDSLDRVKLLLQGYGIEAEIKTTL